MSNKKAVGFFGGKFLPLHLGHIYAMITALNQVDELYIVLSSSKKRDEDICKRDGIKYMSADLRLSWLGESLNNLDNVNIIHIEDNAGESDYNWEDGADRIKSAIGKPIDYIFSSEVNYDHYFKKLYPTSKHVVIDDKRKIVPISATELRSNLYSNWDKIPSCVRSFFTKKVAIVGTESCGKTMLTKKLAKFYNTNYVEEVGRSYCEKYLNQFRPEMFNKIAMEHYLLQLERSENSNKLLFVDTEAVVTQFYLDMYFNGKKSDLIDQIIKIQNYDLVLFLEPDVKWVADGFRFAGEDNQRKINNQKLKEMFKNYGINFFSIEGNYQEKFNKAQELIDNLFTREVSK